MRDRRVNYKRNWRTGKRRWWLSALNMKKIFLLIILLLIQLAGYIGYGWYYQSILYGHEGPDTDAEGHQIVFRGETQPRNAELLGGLTTTVHTYTEEELVNKNKNMDFIYSFVNGTEPNHAFRRTVQSKCIESIQQAELASYNHSDNIEFKCSGKTLLRQATTNGDVLQFIKESVAKTPTTRDRERDELRFSIRSVEQHMQWHSGRLIIISPGHHPLWIDGAKNFMSSSFKSNIGPDTIGKHKRITTVHQDVLMPYGMRLTVDSHTIEMQLFRVSNMTPIHVYLNDDYFINRDVAVTDLVNKHGGTYVRTERGLIQKAVRADSGNSWIGGVAHTNLFNAIELDHNKEDNLPDELIKRWKDAGYNFTHNIPVASSDNLVHVARKYKPVQLPTRANPRRARFFATHAPFVYCTRMFEFLNTRYEFEIAKNTLLNRARKATDIFTPFVYNGFIMARPWQSSPRFLPYLADLKLGRQKKNISPPKPINIVLDNEDACAPATLLRRPASQAVYAKFIDDLEANKRMIKNLDDQKPLFFNINDGFSAANSTWQLKEFLSSRFPTPSYVEYSKDSNSIKNYNNEYNTLMNLPIVIFASYSEAFCPIVRSLKLALPHFNGSIILVRDTTLGEDNLNEVRTRLHHRVISAMPVTFCTFNRKVKYATVQPGQSIGEEVIEALQSSKIPHTEHVILPEDYIHGSNIHIKALAIDARTPDRINNINELTRALEVPGQSLALEDFTLETMSEEVGEGNYILLLAAKNAAQQLVHWVHGAAETDLLVTFPLPSQEFEEMGAKVKWSI